MKGWFAGVKRWWLRRFRGYVAAPPRSGGTSWQQHPGQEWGFTCRCKSVLGFSEENYIVRARDHVEGCPGVYQFSQQLRSLPLACDCPVTDARYVKICPQCGLGHWRQA